MPRCLPRDTESHNSILDRVNNQTCVLKSILPPKSQPLTKSKWLSMDNLNQFSMWNGPFVINLLETSQAQTTVNEFSPCARAHTHLFKHRLCTLCNIHFKIGSSPKFYELEQILGSISYSLKIRG